MTGEFWTVVGVGPKVAADRMWRKNWGGKGVCRDEEPIGGRMFSAMGIIAYTPSTLPFYIPNGWCWKGPPTENLFAWLGSSPHHHTAQRIPGILDSPGFSRQSRTFAWGCGVGLRWAWINTVGFSTMPKYAPTPLCSARSSIHNILPAPTLGFVQAPICSACYICWRRSRRRLLGCCEGSFKTKREMSLGPIDSWEPDDEHVHNINHPLDSTIESKSLEAPLIPRHPSLIP
ncbi:hypothetical protein P691DRAFT_781973 [Macrolepiota fuliginosa MF-IS2]|uniref:Uncharacterized protein n=1 Tax=Macrolepiota fuliginosa MF-IS2 TaxID=1400762 RepID=A0A9P5WWZ6_9AGAR|nr:hypothetical protein P691DRAFT_781973 [Macrolepiota fuliginosa MF-IS2]